MALIQSFSDEVHRQPRALSVYSGSRLPTLPEGTILVGAGDSYAAALAAFYMTGGKFPAFDPYYLATFPDAASGREVVIVSASGRTSSNRLAAERVKGIASRTTALTGDGKSRLASVTDRTVRIPLTLEPRMPGALSFSLTLLALLKMTGTWGSCDFKRSTTELDETRMG